MTTHDHILPRSVLRIVAQFLSRLPRRIVAANGLARSRRALKHLDDHLLCDIGITRAQAMAEAEGARWDAPTHWTC